MRLLDANCLHITIFGLGREGTAVARFLTGRGAHVTLTDLKLAEELAEPLSELKELPIHLALGEHPPQALESDVIFVSPGVPLSIPLLREAQRRRVLLTSEPRLLAALCPAPIIGITGSSGKTTTVTLVGKMLVAEAMTTWVGGNIGAPLINEVGDIHREDQVVVELSSFQLELFAAQPEARTPAGWEVLSQAFSPHIAAILNLTPNHLDRHKSMSAYIEAKRQICRYQDATDICVLGPGLDPSWSHPKARLLRFGRSERMGGEGAFLSDGKVLLRLGGREVHVCHVSEIKLRGEHNVLNVLAACAIAGVAGATIGAMQEVISTFQGVPHRLELVRRHRDVCYYNDSIATSPERACAALRSFDAPIVLLAGGRDKHLPWDEFADVALKRVRHVCCFGEASGLIVEALQAAVRRRQRECPVIMTCEVLSGFEEALAAASSAARPGDVVLLSPGCTSFDEFSDFEERGEHFRQYVNSLV
jgi:UDP-N-acetylmuramoylalanine--D-glutamate ligase